MEKQTLLPTAVAGVLLGTLIAWSLISVQDTSKEARGFAFSDVAVEIPWGTVGVELVESGAIDMEKWSTFYAQRPEALALVSEAQETLQVNAQNADIALNLLWAFGLANKNPVLTEGPMTDPRYGIAGNFASTGGWSLARGAAMAHFAAPSMV